MTLKLRALNYYGHCTINAGTKVIKPLYSFVLIVSVAYNFAITNITKTKQQLYTFKTLYLNLDHPIKAQLFISIL